MNRATVVPTARQLKRRARAPPRPGWTPIVATPKRSTGPRTAEGKGRSSQNALRHGAYANFTRPIQTGVLAEDPDLVAAGVDDIIASLAPRDAVEHRQAQLIAAQYLRLDRLERFEALSLAGDGRWAAVEKEALGDEDVMFYMHNVTLDIETVVAGDDFEAENLAAPEITFEEMASSSSGTSRRTQRCWDCAVP